MSTLVAYPQLVQGSQEWLDARAGIVTASTISKLLTPQLKVADNETSRGLINTLAAERITGNVEYVWPSADMQRGTEQEPYARDAYAEHTNQTVTELGFMVRAYDHVRLGYSPDGLVGDHGLIEIKSRKARIQMQTILEQRAPYANLAQIHAALLVSGREWCDYVSYTPGMPLFVHTVYPDNTWANAILSAAHAAEERINDVIQRYRHAARGLPVTERIPEFEDISI